MYLKSKENRKRINMPVPMGLNQKIGVFFSKQQKTKQLEQQNETLQQKLDLALKNFHQQIQYLKQLKTKNTTTQNICSALSIENQMIQQQNEQTLKTLQELETQKQSLKLKENLLTNKMIDIQKQLFQTTKKYEESSNLLQRYQEEINNEKTLRYAPDSIVNVVAQLQKNLELLKRNIAIHENKLEGKKKYQTLLQKKQLAQAEKLQKTNPKTVKSPKKTLNIYEKTTISHTILNSPSKKIDELKSRQAQKNNKKQMEEKKEQTKKFNELTRKKNALMMQTNSKKAF